MADIANEQQRTAVQRQGAAVRRRVMPVAIEAARDGISAFLEGFLQIAFHEAEPVGVNDNLVFGVDSCDGVLAIHDR